MKKIFDPQHAEIHNIVEMIGLTLYVYTSSSKWYTSEFMNVCLNDNVSAALNYTCTPLVCTMYQSSWRGRCIVWMDSMECFIYYMAVVSEVCASKKTTLTLNEFGGSD